MYNHVNRELSQYVGLHCRQGQTHADRQPQLRSGAVVHRSPKNQGAVGDEEGVGEHQTPGPGDRPQLPKGVEQQVELQDQPEIALENDKLWSLTTDNEEIINKRRFRGRL